MKICSIGAKNFRTLENFELKFGQSYCAISGRNNAGKSAIVKVIQYFLQDEDEYRTHMMDRSAIRFSKDATQWSAPESMEISATFQLDRHDDSELFFFVETFRGKKFPEDSFEIAMSQTFKKDGETVFTCLANQEEIEGQRATEILKKMRSVSNLVIHNSTSPFRRFYFAGESFMEVMEAYFSAEDRKKIAEAEKGLQTRVRKAAQQHKGELEKLLGRLGEKYQVELSSLERGRSARMPLEIKLTDKSVEVPLSDWGSGTQNRTRVLMSVLEATRIRSTVTAEDRSTPIFLVEEPESFLHPSAQAEFGQVLNALADELKIQIIATTHSPYMLNQNDPSANILLERRITRKLPRETTIRDTSGADWMLPFADNLGIVPHEFSSWKSVFGVQSSKVVFVEGEIDKAYFSLFKDIYPDIYSLPSDVEVVSYGGKDSLKATPILQFLINKFGRVFVTFDRDAEHEVKPALERIGLVSETDFCAIGLATPGSDCIEGLLPARIKQKVYADKYDLVSTINSQDTKARNSAKSSLKRALFEEFKSNSLQEKELVEFKRIFATIAKAFS